MSLHESAANFGLTFNPCPFACASAERSACSQGLVGGAVAVEVANPPPRAEVSTRPGCVQARNRQ